MLTREEFQDKVGKDPTGVLNCIKTVWYEEDDETKESQAIGVKGNSYLCCKVGDRVNFVNNLGYSHVWRVNCDDFYKYFEYIEDTKKPKLELNDLIVGEKYKIVRPDDYKTCYSPSWNIYSHTGGMDYLDGHCFTFKGNIDAIYSDYLKVDSWSISPSWLEHVPSVEKDDVEKDTDDKLAPENFEVTPEIQETINEMFKGLEEERNKPLCGVELPNTDVPVNNYSWSDKHYDFTYKHPVTESDLSKGFVEIKLDPYFVAKEWGVGSKDDSGVLIHNLKTIARFGSKNSVEREIKALYAQTVRMAEIYGVGL